MRKRTIHDLDALDVLHEQRQVAEVAPEVVQLLARAVDADGTADEHIVLVRDSQAGGGGIRVAGGRQWRVGAARSCNAFGHGGFLRIVSYARSRAPPSCDAARPASS